MSELSIEQVPAAEAEAVVVPPNGALLESYRFPGLLQQRLAGFERLPLIIFPSSAYFPNQDPSKIFTGRSAPSLWILREGRSFEHLTQRWGELLGRAGVQLALDHDVVATDSFGLVEEFPGVGDRGYVLVAARRDREASPQGVLREPTAGMTRSLVLQLKRYWRSIPSVRRKRLINQLVGYPGQRRAGRLLLERAGAGVDRLGAHLPGRKVCIDASEPSLISYDEYLDLIAGASVVVSDRLHVAMPAALLGKPTIMVEAGYHKLQGVYERSLQHLPNLVFVGP